MSRPEFTEFVPASRQLNQDWKQWYRKKLSRWAPRSDAEANFPENRQRTTRDNHLITEWQWWKDGRPYYNVWPSIGEALDRADLSKVPLNTVLDLPQIVGAETLGLFFPRGFNGMDHFTALTYIADRSGRKEIDTTPYFVCLIETMENGELMRCIRSLPVTDRSMAEEFNDSREISDDGVVTRGSDLWLAMNTACRVAAGVVLLKRGDANGVMTEPDWSGHTDAQRIEAGRRGESPRGCDLGRIVDEPPADVRAHYRRPHFGIRHMRVEGHSDLVPVLRPISGSFVKPDENKVPTGYLGESDER